MMKQEKFEEAPLADEGREGYMDVILDDLGSDSLQLKCMQDITKIVVQTQLTRKHVLSTGWPSTSRTWVGLTLILAVPLPA